MKKVAQLYALLESNGVSSILVDLEKLSFGHLRGVGIYKEHQVDIIESIEVGDNLEPLNACIRLYSTGKLLKTIKLL